MNILFLLLLSVVALAEVNAVHSAARREAELEAPGDVSSGRVKEMNPEMNRISESAAENFESQKRMLMMKKRKKKMKRSDVFVEEGAEYVTGGSKSKGMMGMKSSKKGKGSRKKRGEQLSPAVFVVTNSCVTEGNCIKATNNALYDRRENCEWTISSDATLLVKSFDLEPMIDFVFVNDIGYSGNGISDDGTTINGLSVSAGDTISFLSDGAVEFPGFEICLV